MIDYLFDAFGEGSAFFVCLKVTRVFATEERDETARLTLAI